MNVQEKQQAVYNLLQSIRTDITIEFSSRKTYRRFATTWTIQKRITFYPLIFQYTLESCYHNALHELAHILQQEKYGYSSHDKKHRQIKNELILKHCNKQVLEAKLDNQRSQSAYKYDEQGASEEKEKREKLKKLQQTFKFRK